MIVYKVTNLTNGKVYIGQTTSTLKKRKEQHIYAALKGKPTMTLHHAIRKHGAENFLFETLCECLSQEDMDMKEIEMIQRFNANTEGYNNTSGGQIRQSPGKLGPLFPRLARALKWASKKEKNRPGKFRTKLYALEKKKENQREKVRPSQKRVSEEVRLRIRQDYASRIMISKIARKYGISRTAVYKILIEKYQPLAKGGTAVSDEPK